MRVMDAVKETIADVSSVSPSHSLWRRANAQNVSYCLFHGVHYPHHHSVDTPVCLPPRRRGYPVLLRAGITQQNNETSFRKSTVGHWSERPLTCKSCMMLPVHACSASTSARMSSSASAAATSSSESPPSSRWRRTSGRVPRRFSYATRLSPISCTRLVS